MSRFSFMHAQVWLSIFPLAIYKALTVERRIHRRTLSVALCWSEAPYKPHSTYEIENRKRGDSRVVCSRIVQMQSDWFNETHNGEKRPINK